MGESGENSGIHPADATEPTLTRADVLRLMSERDLRRAVDNGWLTRLRRGVYRLNVTMLQLRMHLIAARAPEAVFALLIGRLAVWVLAHDLSDTREVEGFPLQRPLISRTITTAFVANSSV